MASDHNDLSTGGALSDPDHVKRLYNASNRVYPRQITKAW